MQGRAKTLGTCRTSELFDIRHIKGVEFEAVFFVAVDNLANRIPDLFQRYIYVGLTRAVTFLGIACQTTLPESLEAVRSLFSTGYWD